MKEFKSGIPADKANIEDWARSIGRLADEKGSADLNKEELAAVSNLRRLSLSLEAETRNKGFEAMERIDLPRYKSTNVSLVDFLKDTNKYLDELGSEKFWITVVPRNKDLKRRTLPVPSTREGIHSFFVENMENMGIAENYDVIASQYFENFYGGSIVVDPNGTIHLEFTAGKQDKISKGVIGRDEYFFVDQGELDKTLTYSFEDPVLRKEIFKVLMAIPHHADGAFIEFSPGYYEFVLVRKKKDSPLTPIFTDYRDNENYHIAS